MYKGVVEQEVSNNLANLPWVENYCKRVSDSNLGFFNEKTNTCTSRFNVKKQQRNFCNIFFNI